MAELSSTCSCVRVQSPPRSELLAKVKDIAAGMAHWRELVTALAESYPPTASNLAQIAQLGAGLLMKDALELGALSQELKAPMLLPAVREVLHG